MPTDAGNNSQPVPGSGQPPGEITLLIDAAQAGSADARQRLLEVIYGELQIIARAHMRNERADHTLGATALVNESYMRLFRASQNIPPTYSHRHAFYLAASTAMRRILVDHARARGAVKRAGRFQRIPISADILEASQSADPSDLLSLDDALSRLEQEDDRAATIVRLRFFGGRQIDEVAEMLGITPRTVKRDWEFARARLQQLMEQEQNEPS